MERLTRAQLEAMAKCLNESGFDKKICKKCCMRNTDFCIDEISDDMLLSIIQAALALMDENERLMKERGTLVARLTKVKNELHRIKIRLAQK